MSHSQFHSTKLFILRHAWLNLWDKHMTTGRINQVTTIPNCVVLCLQCHTDTLYSCTEAFSKAGVHHKAYKKMCPHSMTSTAAQPHFPACPLKTQAYLWKHKHAIESPYSSNLTSFRYCSLCLFCSKQKSQPSVRTTSNRTNMTQSRRILE